MLMNLFNLKEGVTNLKFSATIPIAYILRMARNGMEMQLQTTVRYLWLRTDDCDGFHHLNASGSWDSLTNTRTFLGREKRIVFRRLEIHGLFLSSDGLVRESNSDLIAD